MTYHFTHDKKETIIALLQDWNNKNKTGDGTKYAGKIAYYYLHNSNLYNQNLTNIVKILLNSACEVSSEIEDILNEILKGTAENHNYEKLADIILKQPLSNFQNGLKLSVILLPLSAGTADMCLGIQ